jgi:hypothetical protein
VIDIRWDYSAEVHGSDYQIPKGEVNNPLIYAVDAIIAPVSTPRYVVKRLLGAIGMSIGIPVS